MESKEICFYQISDLIPKERIQAITADCERENCCLSVKYRGGTMMGRVINYDKDGNVNFYDRNSREDHVCCRVCWRKWVVKGNPDNFIIEEVK